MSLDFVWPDWVSPPSPADNPRKDVVRDRTRFLLRVAALHATEEGTLSAMSEALGMAPQTIGNYASRRDFIAPELAERIELLTKGVCRAYFFRPDVFPPSHKAKPPKK